MEVYIQPQYDDFTGFTFNGMHSSQFGLLRISDGDRYEDSLVPSLKNETSAIPGGPGEYYHGETIEKKEFKIPVAYDGVGELDKRRIKCWLHPDDQLHELIFDERPYVKYWVKCNKEVVASELCFNDRVGNKIKRVYKGEMELNFVAPMPYALVVNKDINQFDPDNLDASTPRENYEEWKDSSGLIDIDENQIDVFVDNGAKIYNGGDIDVGFELEVDKEEQYYNLTKSNETYSGTESLELYTGTINSYNDLSSLTTYININGKIYNHNIQDLTYPYVKYGNMDGQFVIENEITKFESFTNGIIYDILIKSNEKEIIAYSYNGEIHVYEKDAVVYVLIGEPNYTNIVTSRAHIVDVQRTNNKTTIFLSFLDEVEDINNILLLDMLDFRFDVELIDGQNNLINSFTLAFPSAATTDPRDWTSAQRAGVYGGRIKIDTNKNIVGYITPEEMEGQVYSYNWKGINSVVVEGKLFKLPSNAIDYIFDSNFAFSKIKIVNESEKGFVSNPSISYQYLYV